MKKFMVLMLITLGLLTGCGSDKDSSKSVAEKKELSHIEKLQGKWYYGGEDLGHDIIFAINENNEWSNSLGEMDYVKNSTIEDTGSSLKLISPSKKLEIIYPVYKNGCFDFNIIKSNGNPTNNSSSMKLCKIDDTVSIMCERYYKKDNIRFLQEWMTPSGQDPDTHSIQCNMVAKGIQSVEDFKIWKTDRLETLLQPYKVWKEKYDSLTKEIENLKGKKDYESKTLKRKLTTEKLGLYEVRLDSIKSLNFISSDFNNLSIYHDHSMKYNKEYTSSDEDDYIVEIKSTVQRQNKY